MSVQFWDETGVNPLPPGIEVSVYPKNATQDNANLVGTAFTTAGGLATIDTATAVEYEAIFGLSRQAPAVAADFAGTSSDPTTVIVKGYRSPVLGTTGYAQFQAMHWPTGWFSPAARAPGGNAYGVAILRGAMLGNVDAAAQLVQQALRLQSCVGGQLDSWARDFFGDYLPRYDQEPDSSYYGRIVAMLSMPKCTIAALQNVVVAFYTATAFERGATEYENLTLGDQGGLGTRGGLGVVPGFTPDIPYIYVWDRQSRPDLANQYGINPTNDDGSVVIQIGTALPNDAAWYLGRSYLGIDTFLIDPNSYTLSDTAPDARLAALVNFVAAAGAWPRYLTALVD